MRKSRQILLVVSMILALPLSAYAQASIAGVVKDASGAVLPGVTVEAASPVLIEKARTAVTDGSGPVPHRRSARRHVHRHVHADRIQHRAARRHRAHGSFTAVVNADLKVGALAETITVTGETPIVDTQSVRRQTTISNDLITSIPSARAYAGLMTLMPNTVVATGAASDVQVVPGMVVFGGAGGRSNEGRLQLDGISVGSAFNGGGVSAYIADVGNAQEVAMTTLGRPRRSRSRRTVAERRAEDRRQHGERQRVSVRRHEGDDRQQLHATTSRLAACRRLAPTRRSGTSTAASADRSRRIGCGSSTPCATRAAIGPCPGCSRTSTRAIRPSGPTRPIRIGPPSRPRRSARPRCGSPRRPRRATSSACSGMSRCRAKAPRGRARQRHACRQSGDNEIIAGGTAAPTPAASATAAPETASYRDYGTRFRQVSWQSPMTSRLLVEAGVGNYASRYLGNTMPGSPAFDFIQVTEQCAAGCPANDNRAGLVYRGGTFAQGIVLPRYRLA